MDPLSMCNPPAVIAARTAAIREAVLRDSPRVRRPNFDRIGTDDLARLFALYDRHYFDAWLSQTLAASTPLPLAFRLSGRMTRAGGKTVKYARRGPDGAFRHGYEIAVASRMLFMTFGDVRRPVTVGGLDCGDRLQALQRIMEHEIIHLAELLAWDRSSCSGPRFKALARNIFGHTGATHDLVTVGEHARLRHGVRLGGMVEFQFEGRRLAGRINRIHRRATVLVEDSHGQPYSDGGRYSKFYVPLGALKPLAAEDGPRP